VKRSDILAVMVQGREEGLNPKTVTRRLIVAVMALRNAGAIIQLKRGDWPKTTDRDVEAYEAAELRDFFRACTPNHKLLFQTFLCTGFRKREISTMTWDDVDFRHRILKVRGKPQYGFKPKNHEERSVPVPPALIRRLAARQKTHGEMELIFPTPPHPTRPNYGGDKPNEHHLELCKEIAWRAGLNCRHCTTSSGRCAKGPYCEKWNLHKWRHTYATTMLQSGLDIKSLQDLLGHKNLSTTEKYLKALGIAGLHEKINRSIIAKLIS
jgi:integrase